MAKTSKKYPANAKAAAKIQNTKYQIYWMDEKQHAEFN